MKNCKLPPPGWWCSRVPGHDGPCAAYRISSRDPAYKGDPVFYWTAVAVALVFIPLVLGGLLISVLK